MLSLRHALEPDEAPTGVAAEEGAERHAPGRVLRLNGADLDLDIGARLRRHRRRGLRAAVPGGCRRADLGGGARVVIEA